MHAQFHSLGRQQHYISFTHECFLSIDATQKTIGVLHDTQKAIRASDF